MTGYFQVLFASFVDIFDLSQYFGIVLLYLLKMCFCQWIFILCMFLSSILASCQWTNSICIQRNRISDTIWEHYCTAISPKICKRWFTLTNWVLSRPLPVAIPGWVYFIHGIAHGFDYCLVCLLSLAPLGGEFVSQSECCILHFDKGTGAWRARILIARG